MCNQLCSMSTYTLTHDESCGDTDKDYSLLLWRGARRATQWGEKVPQQHLFLLFPSFTCSPIMLITTQKWIKATKQAQRHTSNTHTHCWVLLVLQGLSTELMNINRSVKKVDLRCKHNFFAVMCDVKSASKCVV